MPHNIHEFCNSFRILYGNGNYHAALKLINEEIEFLPENLNRMLYWKVCIESLIGDYHEALTTLEHMNHKGICVPGRLLEEDPDLIPLRDDPRFSLIVCTNIILRKHRMTTIRPKLKIQCIQNNDSDFVIYYLHGNNRSGEQEKQVFSDMADIEDTMYFPDAPEQGFFKDTYIWDDENAALEYISGIVNLHREQCTTKKIILAGFSRGARTALKIALEHTLKVDGLIAFAPASLKDIAAWEFLYEAPKIPIVVIVGSEDELSHGQSFILLDMLLKGNIPARHRVVENMGHEYASEFEQSFKDALSFIKENPKI